MQTLRKIVSFSFALCLGSAATAFAGMSGDEFSALRAQAEAGDAIAQHNVGLKYADAKDTYYNPIEAYAWLKIAGQNGASGGGFDELKASLTSSQLAEGDRRAEELVALSSKAGKSAVAESPVGPSDAVTGGDLKKYSEELSAAWKENDQMKGELAALRAASANFEGERNALLQKIKDAGQNKVSQPELDAANARIKALADDLEKTKTAAADAAAQAKKLQDLGKQLEQSLQDNAALKGELAKAKSAPAADDVKSQLEAAQVKVEATLRSYDLQQKEVDRLQKALVSVDAERAALADKVAALKAQPAASSTASAQPPAVALPQPAPAPAPALSDEERSELADTKMKLETSLRAFQVKQDELDQVQKAKETLDSEKSSLSSQVESLTAQLAQTRREAAVGREASAQLDITREQLRQTQNQLASVIGERSQMRDHLAGNTRVGGSTLSAPLRPQAVTFASPTPTPSPAPRSYTVVEGDTLTRIAKRLYGDADRWPEILEANRDTLRSPQALRVGMVLRLP